MKTLAAIAILAVAVTFRGGAEEPLPQRESNYSLRNEAELSLGRGLKWLENHQKPDGSWSDPALPGITGLALTAFLREPAGKFRMEPRKARANQACEYLRSTATESGRFGGRESAVFNTAASLSALIVNGDPLDAAVMARAIAYLTARQQPSGGFADEAKAEGTRPPVDLITTETAIEALRIYQIAMADAAPANQQLDWEKAQGFVMRQQLLPGRRKPQFAGIDAGGFYSPAGDRAKFAGPLATSPLTYTGLLCYLYGGVPKDSPKAEAALAWAQRNYTLEEGASASYYYFGLWQMAKGLAAAGARDLDVADGRKVDWARQLALKLLDLQQPDGSWVNRAGASRREDDPALVTSYVCLALEIVYLRL